MIEKRFYILSDRRFSLSSVNASGGEEFSKSFVLDAYPAISKFSPTFPPPPTVLLATIDRGTVYE